MIRVNRAVVLTGIMACSGAPPPAPRAAKLAVGFYLGPDDTYEIVVGPERSRYRSPDHVGVECRAHYALAHLTWAVWDNLEPYQLGTGWMGHVPRVACTGSFRHDAIVVPSAPTSPASLSIELLRGEGEYRVVARSHGEECAGQLEGGAGVAARLALLGAFATANCAVRQDDAGGADLQQAVGVFAYGMFEGLGIDSEYFGPASASDVAADLTEHAMSGYRWWNVQRGTK